jgi:excisionase family DNA binding protein
MATVEEAGGRELAGYLALALRYYEPRARRDGIPVPAALLELRDLLVVVAKSGQEVTNVAPRAVSTEDDAVQRVGYSIEETAQATGLSVRTVRRRIAAGDLAVRRVGRRVVVPRSALDELLGGAR